MLSLVPIRRVQRPGARPGRPEFYRPRPRTEGPEDAHPRSGRPSLHRVTPTIRPRREADLPALEHVLAGQQPASRYPYRWPLPFPVRDFIVRPAEQAAFVAELDGRVVGHVSVTEVAPDDTFAPAWTRATIRPVDELACVSVLFVDQSTQGSGVGGALLDAAVTWAREHGKAPVLDVVQTHGRAEAVYRRRGWQLAGIGRPAWLPDDEPDVLAMVLPEPGEAATTWLPGRVTAGHGVASGRGSTPYPAGTIELQRPHFLARGLDLSDLHPGTVNVDLAPVRWHPTHPEVTFEKVAWSEAIAPETFSFLRARLRHDDAEAAGWIYYPHPETKPQHEQPDSVAELLLPFVPGLQPGAPVEIGVDSARIRATSPDAAP